MAENTQKSAHQATVSEHPTTITKEKAHTNKDTRAQRKEIQKLESAIHKLEKELEQITHTFAALEYGTTHYTDALAKMNILNKKLQEAYAAWEIKQISIPITYPSRFSEGFTSFKYNNN
jgi:septal ring factor EnvC (AmiA/AmiB activator)